VGARSGVRRQQPLDGRPEGRPAVGVVAELVHRGARRSATASPGASLTLPAVLLMTGAGVLLVLGLVMTFSASFVQSTVQDGNPFGIFLRQLLWCGVGLVPTLVAAAVDYRVWRRAAVPLLGIALVACAAVLVPGLGTEVNGARRWFDLGLATFQPSELLKLAVPVGVAHVLALRWERLRRGDLRSLLVPAAPIVVLAALLVLGGPDLETALLVGAIGASVLYAAGLPLRIVAAVAAVGALVASAAVLSTPFRRGRVLAWLDPASDPSNFGYQTLQGFVALGSGGVFGQGLGQSRGKWLYVPNAHTDFIFAIIGEELGLLGALSVLALLMLIAVGGTLTAQRAPDPFGRLIALGVTVWLLLQAGINVGSVVGLLPVTGVTLPLVSFGGSSLVISMIGIGLLISIARAGAAADRRPHP
jgi:cell division protein FtsW